MPALENNNLGRKFEREAIPVSLTEGLRFVGIKQVVFGNAISNASLGGIYDFDKHFDPEAIDAIKSKRTQVAAEIQDEISRMPSGFFPGAAKIGMTALASLADPMQAAVAIAAPELIGSRVRPVVSALAQRAGAAARLASAAGAGATGALSGAAFGTLQAGAHLAVARDFGEDYDALDALKDIGIYAALGGGLEGLAGTFHISDDVNPVEPISVDDQRQIQETAVGQLASDNYVTVEPLIKKAVTNSKERISPDAIPDVENSIEKTKAKIDKGNREVELAKKDLALKTKKFKDQTGQVPPDSTNAVDLANALEDIKAKPITERSALEKDQLKNATKIPIVKHVKKILFKPIEDRTDKETALIKGISLGAEKTILTNENKQLSKLLEKNKAKIASGAKTLKVSVKGPSTIETGARKSISSIEKTIENNKARIDQFDRLDDPAASEIKSSRGNLIKANKDLESNKQRLDDLNVASDFLKKADIPLTGNEVKSMANKQLSADNESPLDTSDDSLKEEIAGVSENPNELSPKIESQVNELKAAGKLSESDIALLDSIEKELLNKPKFDDLISKVANCLTEDVV